MFENEYDSWSKIKKTIVKESVEIFCNKREVWWCSIGMNIGTEIYGKNKKFERPILVIKVYNRRTILAAPLSSKIKPRKITRLDKGQFDEVMNHYKRSL